MKYFILLIVLLSLMGFVNGLSYLGDQKLCLIDSFNNKSCVINNGTLYLISDGILELNAATFTAQNTSADNWMLTLSYGFGLIITFGILFLFYRAYSTYF